MITHSKSFNLSMAIIIAGIVVSAGIILVRGGFIESFFNKGTNENISATTTPGQIEIRPIDKSDHILGNPNAPIILVEYMDYECTFCQEFHVTMRRIMDEFGKEGQVAWVIRHFPLEKIHASSRRAALASECVAKYKGDGAFFEFSNMVFEGAPDSLAEDKIKEIVTSFDITEEQYNSCLTDSEINRAVAEDMTDGEIIYQNDPNFGTPYSFVITNAGIQTAISGSQSYIILKEIIESFL